MAWCGEMKEYWTGELAALHNKDVSGDEFAPKEKWIEAGTPGDATRTHSPGGARPPRPLLLTPLPSYPLCAGTTLTEAMGDRDARRSKATEAEVVETPTGSPVS